MRRLLAIALLIVFAGCGAELPMQGPEDTASDTTDSVAPEDTDESDLDDAPSDTADTEKPPRTYTVAIVSDLNSSYGSTEYVDAVHSAVGFIRNDIEPDLVLSTGDMVAGQKDGLDYRAMWDGFHTTVTDRFDSAAIPFAPTPGNHDASGYEAFQNERNIYIDEWRDRRPDVEMVEDTYYPLRYAFRLGPALFISLDDTMIGPLGGPQMNWLDTVLTDNADAPVKIVYGHVPLWPFAGEKADEIIGDPELETLLEDHGVDMFISGHHHAYYPGQRGDLRMLSMACLGSGQRSLIGEEDRSERSVAVIELDADGIGAVDAWSGPNFTETVAHGSLPQWLEWDDVVITRDDG
jgi:3',5'-cyclic AMP phosphodiesterase CpdA